MSEVEERAAPYLRQIQEKDPLARARAETKLLHQACELLIDDVLVGLEAERVHVAVTDAEIDTGIDAVAKSNHVSVPEVLQMARDQGFTDRAYRDAVRVQLLGGKLLQLQHFDATKMKAEEAFAEFQAKLRTRVYIEVRIAS